MSPGMHTANFPHHDVAPLLIPNDAFHFRAHYNVHDHTETVYYLTPDGEAFWSWFPAQHHGGFSMPGEWDGTFITNSGLVGSTSFLSHPSDGHFSTVGVYHLDGNNYVHVTPFEMSPHDPYLFVGGDDSFLFPG